MWGLSLYCCVSHRFYSAEQRLILHWQPQPPLLCLYYEHLYWPGQVCAGTWTTQWWPRREQDFVPTSRTSWDTYHQQFVLVQVEYCWLVKFSWMCWNVINARTPVPRHWEDPREGRRCPRGRLGVATWADHHVIIFIMSSSSLSLSLSSVSSSAASSQQYLECVH